MADHEIIDHTKEALSVLGDNNKGFWHRVKDFLLEIVIIVFAVTISIWFHDLNERRHQQKEVKEFLLGLKGDLLEDIKEMEVDKKSYINDTKMVDYIARLKKGEPASTDTLQKYGIFFYDYIRFNGNNARLEGFKSSGKLGFIENPELQLDILSLYQENIPNLLMTTDLYNTQKDRLMEHIFKNRKRLTDTTSNIADVMAGDEVQYRAKNLIVAREIVNRYNDCLQKAKKIVEQIEEEYGK